METRVPDFPKYGPGLPTRLLSPAFSCENTAVPMGALRLCSSSGISVSLLLAGGDFSLSQLLAMITISFFFFFKKLYFSSVTCLSVFSEHQILKETFFPFALALRSLDPNWSLTNMKILLPGWPVVHVLLASLPSSYYSPFIFLFPSLSLCKHLHFLVVYNNLS